jgi:hypothetical protein
MQPMFSHFRFLIGADAYVAACYGGAEQHESLCGILRKVGIGAAVIDFSTSYDTSRACQTTPLVANCGQNDTMSAGRIPDALVRFRAEGLLARGRLQRNKVGCCGGHSVELVSLSCHCCAARSNPHRATMFFVA